MSVIARFWDLLNTLAPAQLTVALAVASAALFLVEDRRVSLAALSVQYLLIGVIIGAHVYRPILYLFLGIGMAVFLVLLLSANRVECAVAEARSAQAGTGQTVEPARFETMGPLFSAMALVLAGVAAFEIWRAFPLEGIPQELSLSSYWLVTSGLVLALISNGPLRIGYGVLSFVNGVVSAFLVVERSLMVFALVCALYGILCVGIVVCTEAWLVKARGDVAP